MMRRALLLGLAGLAMLGGCRIDDGLRPFAIVRRADVWQAVISDADRGRLARLQGAWELARADISSAGADAALAALGPVIAPVAGSTPMESQAEQVVLPAPGAYQCRTIRLGWRQGSPRTAPPVQAGDWAPCQLAAAGILLTLETAPAAPGAQRIAGTLYPDVDRLIFLGSVALGGEMGQLRYGDDKDRDQLGVLTMVAPGHWRIALPWPQWSSRLNLIEIRA